MMRQAALLRPIILFCLSFLFAASIQAGSSLLAATEPPFRQVRALQAVAVAGQEQSLSIALDQPDGSIAPFRLAISYPSGAAQELFGEIHGSQTGISWTVPADAGVGAAQFRLTTSGCGCGLRTRPANPVNSESSAVGVFFIQK